MLDVFWKYTQSEEFCLNRTSSSKYAEFVKTGSKQKLF